MTVSTATSRVDYPGNGVTVAFPVPFPFITDAYLVVVRTIIATGVSTTLTLDSIGADGYSVTGAGDSNGTVTVITAPTSLQRLSIIRAVAGTQEADFVANDPFPAETFEDSLDKLQMQINDIATTQSRSPVLFDGDVDGDGRYNANGNRMAELADGVEAQDAATVNQLGEAASANAPFVQAGAGAVARTVQDKLRDLVSVKDFGAVGDGVTDDTAAFARFVTHLNTYGGIGDLGNGRYLIDSDVIDLTMPGTILCGVGKGNAANLTPATTAPTEIIIASATGAGIRVRNQSITLKDFRITSSAARESQAYDINSPGVRIEPDDTSTARADRCVTHDIRIDNHPGDGVLLVGSALFADLRRIDIYECKGFGFRLDPGSLAGLVRTNPHYPGLSVVGECRVGYCGGHTIAASNPGVTSQSEMAIRLTVQDVDSFGNGQNTSIMYASADANFYDFWIFGENCIVEKSAPCGRVGLTLVPELIGGIWIAGRDHQIINCRFIDTKQPIYWGYVAAQPSAGLTVNTLRVVNATLTHTNCIAVQSASATGLRVFFDRIESFTDIAPARVGGVVVDSDVHFQGKKYNVSAITGTGATVTLADDTVHTIPIAGTSASASAQGVLSVACTAVSSGGGIFHVRLASSSPIATKWAGEANTIAYAGGGALTGTTGTDTTMNISCDNTNIYIENRRGFSITFTYQLSAFTRGTHI